MNPVKAVEKKPRDWIISTAVVFAECLVMFALGYFARPEIQKFFGG